MPQPGSVIRSYYRAGSVAVMTNPEDHDDSGAPSEPVRAEPHRLVETFGRATPATVSEANAAGDGRLVKVSGRAMPGPDGPLRAPLSGAECVWYRSIVMREVRDRSYGSAAGGRHYPLRPMNPIALSDLPDYGVDHRMNARGERLGSDTSSTATFAVGDGESQVLIDPRTTDIDVDVFGINQVVRAGSEQRGIGIGPVEFRGGPFGPDELHTEWIIPVGAELLALGTVHRDGVGTTLATRGDDVALVSTKPEQRILARSAAGTRAGLGSPRTVAFVIGGVTLLVVAIVAVVVFATILH